MTTKPFVIKNLEDLQDYYWTKSALIVFCKKHDLPTQGGKFDLIERIKVYLSTGQRTNYKAASKTTKRDSSNPITKNTLVKNYNNDAATRKFFVEYIGKNFKFNAYLRKFTNPANILPNMTYGDLIEGWATFENSRKVKNEDHVISPQFEYNQFIKDYFKDEKGATLEMAISIWKSLTSKKGPRTYEQYKKLNRLVKL